MIGKPVAHGNRQAVLLDRDGVLIEDSKDYICSATDVRLLPGASEALAALRHAGFLTVLVTNQSAVAHGYIDKSTLRTIHRQLKHLLALGHPDAKLDRIYYCPYHPQARLRRYRRNSKLRKPRPGMLLKAARELGLDLHRSYMVGDRKIDISAAAAAGCTPIFVTTGLVAYEERGDAQGAGPAFVAPNLQEVASWILCREFELRETQDDEHSTS